MQINCMSLCIAVCSIHLLTCHLISRLRSRARQHIIHQIYIWIACHKTCANDVAERVTEITMRLFWMCMACMPNGSCDVKPTDQLSDKTGDDQCAVALHHRFLGTFIIMWQLDFSMWIFNHRNFFRISHIVQSTALPQMILLLYAISLSKSFALKKLKRK